MRKHLQKGMWLLVLIKQILKIVSPGYMNIKYYSSKYSINGITTFVIVLLGVLSLILLYTILFTIYLIELIIK